MGTAGIDAFFCPKAHPRIRLFHQSPPTNDWSLRSLPCSILSSVPAFSFLPSVRQSFQFQLSETTRGLLHPAPTTHLRNERSVITCSFIQNRKVSYLTQTCSLQRRSVRTEHAGRFAKLLIDPTSEAAANLPSNGLESICIICEDQIAVSSIRGGSRPTEQARMDLASSCVQLQQPDPDGQGGGFARFVTFFDQPGVPFRCFQGRPICLTSDDDTRKHFKQLAGGCSDLACMHRHHIAETES